MISVLRQHLSADISCTTVYTVRSLNCKTNFPLCWHELPHWMPIAHDVSAKFKAFSFPVIKSYSAIPLFRIPRFTASHF